MPYPTPSSNQPVDPRMSTFVPTELQHNVTPFRQNQASDPTPATQQFGLFLVGLCLIVTSFSVATVTTQVAELWVTEAQQEINARITPSRWNF